MLVILVSIQGIFHGYHNLMQFFSLADAYFGHFTSGQHCLCQICDLERRNLGDKGFTALGFFQCLNDQFYALLQADPETCHAVIGNRKFSAPLFDDVVKERNNGTAASCYITVTNDGEADIFASSVGIGSNKQLIGYQLGTAVQINRINSLVCG